MKRWILALAVASAPGLALAQAPALPETSRAQQQSEQLGRAIDAQQRVLMQSQQNQFEINQLRGEVLRQNTLPPPLPLGCAAGRRRC